MPSFIYHIESIIRFNQEKFITFFLPEFLVFLLNLLQNRFIRSEDRQLFSEIFSLIPEHISSSDHLLVYLNYTFEFLKTPNLSIEELYNILYIFDIILPRLPKSAIDTTIVPFIFYSLNPSLSADNHIELLYITGRLCEKELIEKGMLIKSIFNPVNITSQ